MHESKETKVIEKDAIASSSDPCLSWIKEIKRLRSEERTRRSLCETKEDSAIVLSYEIISHMMEQVRGYNQAMLRESHLRDYFFLD